MLTYQDALDIHAGLYNLECVLRLMVGESETVCKLYDNITSLRRNEAMQLVNEMQEKINV